MRPNRGQREGAGAPKRTRPVLCPGRRAQEGVGEASLCESEFESSVPSSAADE